MKLWVLRHGEAEAMAPRDAERALTELGREQLLQSVAHLREQPLAAIYASPYLRTQQSARIVQQALGFNGEIHTAPWLTPDARLSGVLEHLHGIDQPHVLLVSHQPLVGSLIGLLQHGHLREPQAMNTASLAELEGEWLLAGSMQLRAVHHP